MITQPALQELTRCFHERILNERPKKSVRSGPQFKGAVVGEATEQVLPGKYADETTALIENRNRMDPFLQHDSGDFTDLRGWGCRDHSLSHDLRSMLVGSQLCIGRCDQFRDVMEEIPIREHSHERAM